MSSEKDDVIYRIARKIAGEPFSAGPHTDAINELHIEAMAVELRAALRAVADTHRLVPVVPTRKMMREGVDPEDWYGWLEKATQNNNLP